MDGARFVLAIVLTIAVVVITNLLFPPAPPRPPAGVEGVDTAVLADTLAPPPQAPEPQPAPAETAAVEAAPPAAAGIPGPVAGPAAEPLPADTVEAVSPFYRYAFTTLGGGLVAAELLLHESFTRPGPVELVPDDGPPLVRYGLRVDGRDIELDALPFRVATAGDLRLEPGGGPDTLTLVHDAPGSPFGVTLTYVFEADNYLIGVRGEVRGLGDAAPLLLIRTGPTLAVNEADARENRAALAFVVNSTEEGIRSVPLRDVEARRVVEGPLVWTALKNKYFVLAALPPADVQEVPFGGLIAEDAEAEDAAHLTTTLPVGRDGRFAFRLYAGPQEYDRLAAVGYDLPDVNPYGWQVLRPIIRPLAHVIIWALVGLRDVLGIAYGWVLILFGVLIQVVLWPLNARAMRSQMKNMELQPRLKEIQEKYRKEPERLQREMLRLYKEEGFNPLGGCLPMLIPFPVLITLFFVFQSTIEFRGVEFLWLPDLSRPDPIYIIPILLGVSMFFMQKLSMSTTTAPNPQMKAMMWFMPIFMVIIFFNLASGLNLYYLSSNVASIPRQLLLIRERRRRQEAAGR